MTTEKKVKDYGKKAADLIRFLSILTKDEKISKLSENIEKATENEKLVTSVAKLFDRSSSESDNEPDKDNALASDDGIKDSMIAGINIENEDHQSDNAVAANNEDSDVNAVQDGGLMEDEEDQIIEKVKDGPALFNLKICYDSVLPKNFSIQEIYNLNSCPRGMVLIYNISNINGANRRRGSEHDVRNLNNLFLRLGYFVKIMEDYSAEQFRESLRKESSDEELKHMDSFIVFIMTHGTSNEVMYMQDDEAISLNYVEQQLDGKNAPLLINKPKLIFVQACRKAIGAKVPYIEHDAKIFEENQPHEKADIFVSYSTYEGCKSARIPNKGTWFIRALVLVLEKHAHRWTYSDIMLCVQRIVNKIEAKDFRQIPQKKDSARYHFFFSPISVPELVFQASSLMN